MKLIDSHCHLVHGRLRQQLQPVLERARQAGVAAMVCAAGSLEESAASGGLAREHERVYSTAGVHPHDAKDVADGYLDLLRAHAAEAGNVAIGEIGLDYYRDLSPREVQRRVFAEQLQLAGRLGERIVIHTREAFDDTMAILAASGVDGERVVFHSCTEPEENVRRALDAGAAIGFSGIVTFRKSGYLRQAAAVVPDGKLLIETDAPYLSPEPVRKMKTNEPANVVHVAACLAAVRGATPEALAELTTANAVRFFGLDVSGV